MIHAGQAVVANPTARKGFLIPVSWEVSDYVRVQANSLKEALEWLEEHSDEVPLGTEPTYVDASYQVGSIEECENYLNEMVEYGTPLCYTCENNSRWEAMACTTCARNKECSSFFECSETGQNKCST